MMRGWFCFVCCYVKCWTRTSIQMYPYLYFFSYFYLLLSNDSGHQPASSEVTRTDLRGTGWGCLPELCKFLTMGLNSLWDRAHCLLALCLFWSSYFTWTSCVHKLERGIMDVFLVSDHFQSRNLSMLFFRDWCEFNPPMWWQSNQVLLTAFWVIEQRLVQFLFPLTKLKYGLLFAVASTSLFGWKHGNEAVFACFMSHPVLTEPVRPEPATV